MTLAVLCGVAGTVGFPITPGDSGGGEFPCQGHGCGCRSAADCWAGCCCLTPAQRLAWAKRNGVTPPADLVALAKLDEPPPEPRPEPPACCGGKSRSCRRQDAPARKTCCSAKAAPAASRREARRAADGPLLTKLRCRGLGQWWVAAGQPLGLPERPAELAASTVAAPVVLASTDYSFLLSPPPTRPG